MRKVKTQKIGSYTFEVSVYLAESRRFNVTVTCIDKGVSYITEDIATPADLPRTINDHLKRADKWVQKQNPPGVEDGIKFLEENGFKNG